jgi:hypothetical protein
VGWIHAKISRSTAANAEGRNLIHINPDAINGHLLLPDSDFFCPEIPSLRIVPVREDSVAGPDSANVLASIGILQEDVILVSASVGIVAKYKLVLFLQDRLRGTYASEALLGFGM